MEKILIYTLTENIGGVEEYVMNLLRYSTNGKEKYGYIILGENCPYEEELIKREADYYYLPTKKNIIKSLLKTYLLFRALRKTYTVIYFNTSALGYIVPYLYAIFFNYKIVLHSHSDGSAISSFFKQCIQRFHYQLIKRRIFKKLACSKTAANWMFDEEIDDVTIIPNAIQLERFRYDANARIKIRKKKGLEDTFVIGNVGRLTAYKNQAFIIKILAELVRQTFNACLILVGEGEDRNELEKIASELNLSDKVIFWGRTSKPEYVMNCMDCVVLPSITEGFPISIIEAQAAGLPCLVSDSVTQEIDITGDVKFESLSSAPKIWAQRIMSMNFERHDNIQMLRARGYDVLQLEKYVWDILKS